MKDQVKREYNLTVLDQLFTRGIEEIKALSTAVDEVRKTGTDLTIQQDLSGVYSSLSEIIFRLAWLRSRIPRVAVDEKTIYASNEKGGS